jgi:tetratricopeptide (TPR) repeat protein
MNEGDPPSEGADRRRPGADLAPLKDVADGGPPGGAEADPYQRDSLHAEEALRHAAALSEAGEADRAVQEYLRAAKIAETAREWHVAAVALLRVGEFLENPRPPSDLERALRTYRRAVAAYQQCGLFDEARQLGYRLQCLKMRRARELGLPWRVRAELRAYWLAAGFGYRPLRVVACAAAAVVLFGVLYWWIGGVRQPGAEGEAVGVWDAIYFSGVTFATVGYGDLVPAPHARPLALAEGALGAFSVGFFVVVLANRLRH